MKEEDFIDGLKHENIIMRRMCLDALFNINNPRYNLAYECLLSEKDPFLRARIFRGLMAAKHNMSAVAIKLLKDRYPINRMLAFKYICDTDKESALKTAISLLLDKNAEVRRNSREYLSIQKNEFDYRKYYKSNLTNKTAPAILGLSETGKPEDIVEIESYLKSSTIAVVRAAMTGVMRLNSSKYISIITEYLADERPGIVKTAKNLIENTNSPNYARIMEICNLAKNTNTKQKCFSVLITASKWQRLIYILAILENANEDIYRTVSDALNRWILTYNRSFTAPSKEQRQEISESIIRLKGKIQENTRKEIIFLLG